MQTDFSPAQLADPAMATSQSVIRKCVHCGFCTATCPTYMLLGDELDSPRGRIYLIKQMLETEAQPSAEVVKHIDRCLSCLACMTTCPSGVNYMHLVDHARAYIDQHYRRPLRERLVRALLAAVLPYPRRFRAALQLARLARPMEKMLGQIQALRPLAAMLALAPRRLPPTAAVPKSAAAAPACRVALLQGCAEPVLRPDIRAATVRLLNRCGVEVVFARGEACCGALVHHLGREADSLAAARRNVDAWTTEIEGAGLAAIVITASGCGTAIKDYGFLLRNDPDYARKAARVSDLARDVSELLAGLELPPADPTGAHAGLVVAYHAACSLQHGQAVTEAPKRLLAKAGFCVRVPIEAHVCCGSAGTYNILQPAIAGQLGDRKTANLHRLRPDLIATGNIGCAMQIGQRATVPVLHLVELLDWAHGGPAPAALTDFFAHTEAILTQLSLAQAHAIAAAALAKGEALGLKPLTVAVLDAGGHLILLHRQDGASLLRPQIAIAKASGALALGVSSRKIAAMAAERPSFVAALNPIAAHGVMPAAGGVIVVDAQGAPVGAVGITGDTSDHDEACVLAGIEAAGLVAQS